MNEAHFEKMAAKALEDVFQQLGWQPSATKWRPQTNRFVSKMVFLLPHPKKKLWEFIRGTLKCPHFVQDGYHDLFCVLGGGESKSAIVFW